MGWTIMGCTNSTQFGTEVALPSATLTSPQPQLIGNGPTIVKPMELGIPMSTAMGAGGRLKTLSSDGFDNIPDKSRQTSAQSNITTLSVASKGIAYEFNLDDNPTEPSIVKAHPPKALKKMEMMAEQKLTIEKLLEKQRDAEERKNRVIKENVEKAQSLARPKTAIPSKGRQKHFQEQLEEKLSVAEAKLHQKQEEMNARQRHREEKAKKAREKAKQLQFPEFEQKLESFGKEEIPITPIPKVQNSPTLTKKPTETDAFFD